MTGSRTLPFFLLTFAFTWALQIPGVLALRGALPGHLELYQTLAALGIFGPSVAALTIAHREGGRAALRALLKPLLAFRVGPRFYWLALAPAPLLGLILIALRGMGRSGPVWYGPTAAGLVLGVVISVVEEIGWRGFALPRLKERWGSFGASVILGACWTLWHVPMFLGQGIPMTLMPVMILLLTGASLLFTAIYNGTDGSLVLMSVAHLTAHLNNSHRALPDDVVPLLVHSIVYAGLGFLAIRKFRPTLQRRSADRTSSTS